MNRVTNIIDLELKQSEMFLEELQEFVNEGYKRNGYQETDDYVVYTKVLIEEQIKHIERLKRRVK